MEEGSKKKGRTKLNGEKDNRGKVSKERNEQRKTINEKVVKLSLNKALIEKKLLPVIEELVFNISQLKVRASHILNALILEACETDSFPKFSDQTFWNQLITIGAKRKKKLTSPNLFIENIYNKFFKDYPIPLAPISGDTQVISYAGIELKTVFINSIKFRLLDRQKYFIYKWLVKNNLEPKDNVFPIQCAINGWNCNTEPLVEASDFILQHKELLVDLGETVSETSIGMNLNCALKYMYRLLVEQETENEIANEEERQKLFCLVPYFHIRRHFVSIDTTTLIALLKSLNLVSKNSDEEIAWDSCFETKKFKNNASFSGMIDTDGISCCIHYHQTKSDKQLQDEAAITYFNTMEKEFKAKKKAKTISKEETECWTKMKKEFKEKIHDEREAQISALKDTCRKIGIDPGRTNIIYAVENIDGKEVSYVLTRNEYYNKSGMTQRNSRTKSWEKKELFEENLDVAKYSPKTSNIEKFLEYSNSIKRNWVALWKSKFSKKRARESLRVYRLRLKTIDKFFQSFMSGKEGEERPVIAFGNAKFSSSGKNEKSVPTCSMHKRCKNHYETVPTDEWCSTQYHHVCHHRLSNVNIRKEYFDKKLKEMKEQTISVRGLKWCSHCQHFVNRDKNAGINIRDCLIERPSIFNRSTPREELPTSVWCIGFNKRILGGDSFKDNPLCSLGRE
jgi:hypothetical protein